MLDSVVSSEVVLGLPEASVVVDGVETTVVLVEDVTDGKMYIMKLYLT